MIEYAWVPVNLPEGICVCLEFRCEPFMWTIIQVDNVRIDHNSMLVYDWRIIHPGDSNNLESPKLSKYIESAINDRINALVESGVTENGNNSEVFECNTFNIEKVANNKNLNS